LTSKRKADGDVVGGSRKLNTVENK